MTRHLARDDLMAIVGELGRGPVRDVGLLDAARQRPRSNAWGEDASPDVHDRGAVLMASIGRNHAPVDGNRRLCWAAGVVFPAVKGHGADAPHGEAFDLVVGVCTGRVGYPETARALRVRSAVRPSPRRAIPVRRRPDPRSLPPWRDSGSRSATSASRAPRRLRSCSGTSSPRRAPRRTRASRPCG